MNTYTHAWLHISKFKPKTHAWLHVCIYVSTRTRKYIYNTCIHGCDKNIIYICVHGYLFLKCKYIHMILSMYMATCTSYIYIPPAYTCAYVYKCRLKQKHTCQCAYTHAYTFTFYICSHVHAHATKHVSGILYHTKSQRYADCLGPLRLCNVCIHTYFIVYTLQIILC